MKQEARTMYRIFVSHPCMPIPGQANLFTTNSYYYIGHFSKFLRPGAKRISSAASRSQLPTTAFINTDGKVAVIVMNQSNAKTPYVLWINGKAAELTALPHSIATLAF